MRKLHVAPVILILVLSLALLAGCGGKTALEKARTYGYETSNIYLNLDREYRATYESAGEEDRAWLTENVRPLMVKVKAGLITYNDAVILWSRLAERTEAAGEADEETSTLLAQLKEQIEAKQLSLDDLLLDIINLIAKFRQ